MTHKFGGEWTQLKLNILESYLHFFATALKKQYFNIIYIDAFAGTGECEIKLQNTTGIIKGSARIALETQPGFHKLYFIDEKKKHVNKLKALCREYPHAEIFHADANTKVRELCKTINWRHYRAVMFLDPYGLEIEWETLKSISATKSIDVCFLFPLSGVFRQAAIDFNKVDESKAKSLDSCLGTSEWREAFYTRTGQQDMFSGEQAPIREIGVKEIEDYIKLRLETIFAAVSEPLRLPKNGAPLYSLFIAVSNPAQKATKLAMKIAKHIFNSSRN